MNTRGVEVVAGSLVCGFPLSIPGAFWGRVQHAVERSGQTADFAADKAATAARAKDSRTPWVEWEGMFMRWVERLGLPSERWPWQSGWTEDDVDAYLVPVEARRAA